jgi:hypothetical protein
MTRSARTRTCPRSPALEPLAAAVVALALASLAVAGCNVIDAVRGRHARITKMVPGGNIGNGQLDCWITLEFDRYPDGADLRDVRVRFDSIALQEPAEFDWAYIASRDVAAKGGDFGGGYRKADETRPGEKPPLGKPTKVRLPLRAKPKIENAPSTLWLEAELYWGGKKQDSERRTLEHVYASTPNGFF